VCEVRVDEGGMLLLFMLGYDSEESRRGENGLVDECVEVVEVEEVEEEVVDVVDVVDVVEVVAVEEVEGVEEEEGVKVEGEGGAEL
jgi:hypothetical protein